jgi:hypothetical protein
MLRYLSLLALLVTTACATANNTTTSCANPTKVVSADGTYYEYTCAEVVDSNPLKSIKIVDNWTPVLNPISFKQRWLDVKYEAEGSINYQVNQRNLNCPVRIKTVTPYPTNDKNHLEWFKCQQWMHADASEDLTNLQDILLSWASNPKDVMKPRRGGPTNFSVSGYDIPSTIGTFSQLYALWYNEFRYTPKERALVDAYLTRKLMEQKFPTIGGGARKCNPNNPKSTILGNTNAGYSVTDSNNCGSIRIKVATAEIMLGLRLKDQAMLDKGHDDIWHVLTQVDADGVWVNYAARGANNFSYYMEYLTALSVLTEVYYALGYDFLEMELKHGAKVHQIYYHGYKLLKDHTYLGKYARYNLGSMSYRYSEVKNMSREEWLTISSTHNSYKDPTDDTEWVNLHSRYVSKYMPHLPIVLGYTDSPQSVSANVPVSSDMFYWGNTIKYKEPEPQPVMDYSLKQSEGNGWRKSVFISGATN